MSLFLNRLGPSPSRNPIALLSPPVDSTSSSNSPSTPSSGRKQRAKNTHVGALFSNPNARNVLRLRGSHYTDELVVGHMRAGIHRCSIGGVNEDNKNGGIEHIDLRESRVSDKGVVVLARACRDTLKSIDLSQTSISDSSLSALGSFCPNLVSLRANGTSITNAGIMQIAKALGDTLRRVELRGTAIDDAGVRVLADSCPRLRVVGLDFTEVTIKALVSLKERCTELQRVTCAMNHAQPGGLGGLSLFEPHRGPVHDQYAEAITKAHTIPVDTGAWRGLRQPVRRSRRRGMLGYGLDENTLSAVAPNPETNVRPSVSQQSPASDDGYEDDFDAEDEDSDAISAIVAAAKGSNANKHGPATRSTEAHMERVIAENDRLERENKALKMTSSRAGIGGWAPRRSMRIGRA